MVALVGDRLLKALPIAVVIVEKRSVVSWYRESLVVIVCPHIDRLDLS